MTGIEAASQIRQRRDVPVIYITAYASVLAEAGETDEKPLCLSKPFSSGELKKVLDAALGPAES